MVTLYSIVLLSFLLPSVIVQAAPSWYDGVFVSKNHTSNQSSRFLFNNYGQPRFLDENRLLQMKEYYHKLQRLRNERRSMQQHHHLDDSDNTNSTHPRVLYHDDGPYLPTEELRWNKFEFPPNVNTRYYADFKPLTSKDFPIRGYVNKTLRITTAHSVVTPDDYEVKYNIPSLLDDVGGYPPMPVNDESSIFWKYLGVVIYAQKVRRTNPNRKLFPRADLWEDLDLEDVATAVHNEYPGYHPSRLIYRMIQGDYGGEVVIDNTIIFKRGNIQFLHRDYMLADVNTWAINFVGPHNFALKYYIGRPRPEEVVWAIKTNLITEGIPAKIKAAVKELDIHSAEEFTAYPEGCPNHPAFPAMHGANGGTSLWIAVVLNLNDEQLCQVRLTDYAVGFARTVAGVHYPDDTIVGLNVAQEVLSRALPGYLAEKYGSDPDVVRKKILKVRYNWLTFDPKNPCPWLKNKYKYGYGSHDDDFIENVVEPNMEEYYWNKYD